MTGFEWFKFIHVVAAIVWVGGAITAQIIALRLKSADPAHRLGFARDMRFTSQWVFLPAALVGYITGELMVADVAAFGHDQAWITIGIAGFAVSFLVAAGYLVPRIRRAVRLLEAGQFPEGGAVMRQTAYAARTIVVILVVVVWAMVAKPGL